MDLKKRGKLEQIIQEYKENIFPLTFNEEIYKWELLTEFGGRPNTDAEDFFEEIKSLNYSNLIYPIAYGVLKRMAEHKPEELRNLFKLLFNEEKDLFERIKNFRASATSLYKTTKGEHGSHQDERSIATYLTFKYPEKYTFYQAKIYGLLCEDLGENKAPVNRRYIHYLSLIDELVSLIELEEQELITRTEKELPKGKIINNRLVAQNIIFSFYKKNTRVPNHWIFQGNPKVYDFETALRENLIEDWTVSAHKDKIKPGDKAILWITGQNAGVYALADITSKPEPKATAADDHLWKEVDKSEMKASIKITHNLVDNPILKAEVDAIEDLKNLNVGNQGTNFKATDNEYNVLMKMISNMGSNKKYWVYSPGKIASKWNEFYAQGIMGLGWNELGDLNQYKTKQEIEKRLQELHETKKSKKNDTTANYEFKNEISIGDIVIAKKGRSKYLGYGVVTSDYYFDASRESYQSLRKVDWKKKGSWEEVKHSIVVKTLTDVTKYPNYVNRLIELIGIDQEEHEEVKVRTIYEPLNQILCGPPGTGKTYNTINKSLEIINDEEVEQLDWSNRNNVKMLFDKKVKDGQIVFTTFHQSMSYEDFIEGIKPIEPKDDEDFLTYKVEPGLFKRLCIEASFSIGKEMMSKEITETLDFSNLYDVFIEDVQEKLINNEEVELTTKSGGTVLIDSISSQGNVIIKHQNGSRKYTVSKPRLTKLQSAIDSLESVSNINDEFREIIGGSNSSAYWSVLNAIKNITNKVKIKTDEKTYNFEDKVQAVKKMRTNDYIFDKGRNYVLIIDEVNRGNVSQIFGELITLIEEDKRLGKNEALEVILPYSKEKFGIPPNLYIIGTMNTADRSVEALDTALRRRFSFVEVMPQPGILAKSGENGSGRVEGVDLEDLLSTINERIEVLVDRDHTIGHAYFLEVKNRKDLSAVFKNKIIPLLQEYFYGDYAKMEMVIGSEFFDKKNVDKVRFASISDDYTPEGVIYQIKDVESADFDIVNAIEVLLNKNAEE